MYKAEEIAVNYIVSSAIERQGHIHSINFYLKKGYHIKVCPNGCWVLFKPAKVLVTAYCGESGVFTHDMKDEILKRYGCSDVSIELIDVFRVDFNNGVFSLEADENGFAIK